MFLNLFFWGKKCSIYQFPDWFRAFVSHVNPRCIFHSEIRYFLFPRPPSFQIRILAIASPHTRNVVLGADWTVTISRSVSYQRHDAGIYRLADKKYFCIQAHGGVSGALCVLFFPSPVSFHALLWHLHSFFNHLPPDIIQLSDFPVCCHIALSGH